MACSQGTSAILTLGGVDPRSGRHYVSYETVKGGFGARPNKDGINCIASGISNTMNTPVEVLEMAFPVRVERYEINPDSGGAGRYRGGCGSIRVWRVLEGADATGALCMERMTSPPFGLLGGKAGAAAVVTLTTPDGATRHLPSKGAFDAPAGSIIEMITPGSGGFGSARERDPAAIGRDLLDGYVSAAAASTITALPIRRRCERKPPHRRSKREPHPELDRGPRRREPRAHADQPAQAPAGRPAGHRARQGARYSTNAGREYIEAIAGLWCASLGFGSERLAKVAYEQMRKLGYYHLYRHRSNEPAIELAETLLRIAPVPMARVDVPVLGLGGQRHRHQARLVLLERRRASRSGPRSSRVAWPITATPARPSACPASRTCTPASACRSHRSSTPSFPTITAVTSRARARTEFSARMAEALEELIQAEGPETIAAFFAEPVMGAGGAVLPPQGYFDEVQAVLRKYDILFVADEVICGFARTGEMWGSQTYGIGPT